MHTLTCNLSELFITYAPQVCHLLKTVHIIFTDYMNLG
nr:MAG TPA: hypothetical protein [Podoviridae sp. ctY3D12]